MLPSATILLAVSTATGANSTQELNMPLSRRELLPSGETRVPPPSRGEPGFRPSDEEPERHPSGEEGGAEPRTEPLRSGPVDEKPIGFGEYPIPFDFPSTLVGSAGHVAVWNAMGYDTKAIELAHQLLGAVVNPYNILQGWFGVAANAYNKVSVVIAPMSVSGRVRFDGSAGAYHYDCSFSDGGVLYIDATYENTRVNPLDLAVGLYVAELSECFMGAQLRDWDCGSSNGEGLSRFCAEQLTPFNTIYQFATTRLWGAAGFPDWVNNTAPTDGDTVATGCCVAYLYWMLGLGFTIPQIVQASGATLAANYLTLTGKSTALPDLLAAMPPLDFGGNASPFWIYDNPFYNAVAAR